MHSWRTAIVIILVAVCVHGMIEHRYGPGDIAVRQGDPATLHCAFNGQGSEKVFWYRLGTGEILSQNEHVSQGSRPTMGRYEITGNHHDGEYNLHITNAQRSDSDEYRCGFERGPDHIYLGAYLRVMVPPTLQYPACLLITDRNEIGQMTKLSCISRGGDPPATLTWERNGQPITQPKTNRNELDHIMEAEDVGVTFRCVADSQAMREVRSCSLQPLRHMPSVMVSPRVGYTDVGGSITFACQKQDQQPDDSYVWYFNGNKVLPDSSTKRRFRLSGDKKSLTIGKISVDDHNAAIVCKVDNGSSAIVGATATLSISGIQLKNTEPPKVTVDQKLPKDPNARGHPVTGRGHYVPTTMSNNKIALIAVSIIGGLAIALLAVIFYLYIQRKVNRKPRQTTIPMTPRSSGRSFYRNSSIMKSWLRKDSSQRGSSIIKSWRRKDSTQTISSPESYAALNMTGKHNYQDLKSVASCPSFANALPLTMMTACALPLPPITPSAPPLSVRVPSHTNIDFIFEGEEDAESNDSYETIDDKISKPNRTENKPGSEYLEILA